MDGRRFCCSCCCCQTVSPALQVAARARVAVLTLDFGRLIACVCVCARHAPGSVRRSRVPCCFVRFFGVLFVCSFCLERVGALACLACCCTRHVPGIVGEFVESLGSPRFMKNWPSLKR